MCVSSNSAVFLQDSYFVNNSAGQSGAIDAQKNVTVALKNCSFIDNTASTAGGALAAGWNASLQIDHCLFQANVANYIGTAMILANSATLQMNNSVVFNNSGGISVIRGDNHTYIHLDNSRIINNTGKHHY